MAQQEKWGTGCCMIPETINWISVSESLRPGDETCILVFTSDGECRPALFEDGLWYAASGVTLAKRITHWTKMPVGPKQNFDYPETTPGSELAKKIRRDSNGKIPRYRLEADHHGWHIIDRWEPLHTQVLVTLASKEVAEKTVEGLNRGIIERQNVAPDGRWTEKGVA